MPNFVQNGQSVWIFVENQHINTHSLCIIWHYCDVISDLAGVPVFIFVTIDFYIPCLYHRTQNVARGIRFVLVYIQTVINRSSSSSVDFERQFCFIGLLRVFRNVFDVLLERSWGTCLHTEQDGS